MLKNKMNQFIKNTYYTNIEFLDDTNPALDFIYFLSSNNLVVDQYTSQDILNNYLDNLNGYFSLMRHNFYTDLYNKASLFWRLLFKDNFEKEAEKYAKKYNLYLSTCEEKLVSLAMNRINVIVNASNQEYH